MDPKRIAIVGGGISGLAAAYVLARAREQGAPIEEHLFEASQRLGGALRTEQLAGCLVEAGADSFLTEKAEARELCQEVGLGAELVGSLDHRRQTWILQGRALHRLPDGFEFFVPTRILPVLRTGLLSWTDKWSLAREFLRRPVIPEADESVRSFLARHFPPSLIDNIVDPLLAGIYGGSASSLSVRAVLPRFVEMERDRGSLVRGVLAARRQRRKPHGGGQESRPPLFTTLRNGVSSLADALEKTLPASRIHRGYQLKSVVRREERCGAAYRLVLEQGKVFDTDAVVLALPAYESGRIVRKLDGELSEHLASIPYASSLIIALVYERETCRRLPAGFGFLVPHGQGYRLRAATIVNNKFPGRVPSHLELLRCFLGGVRDESVLELSDEKAAELVRGELKEILGFTATPRAVGVYRWPRVMAQYQVGHLERLQAIEARLRHHPGLQLAGNALRGIGVSDCIRSGRQAATACLEIVTCSADGSVPRPRD